MCWVELSGTESATTVRINRKQKPNRNHARLVWDEETAEKGGQRARRRGGRGAAREIRDGGGRTSAVAFAFAFAFVRIRAPTC